MSEHTKTPWEVETPMGDETPWIVEAGLEAYQWRCIAMTCADGSDEGHDALTIEEAAANAAFIVKAVNNHESLVKALENARRDLLLLKSRSDTGSLRNRQIEAAAERAREALAKASQ